MLKKQTKQSYTTRLRQMSAIGLVLALVLLMALPVVAVSVGEARFGKNVVIVDVMNKRSQVFRPGVHWTQLHSSCANVSGPRGGQYLKSGGVTTCSLRIGDATFYVAWFEGSGGRRAA